MKEYKVGDVVWSAYAGTRSVERKCEVCFGKLSVILELGNGERIKMPCQYCGDIISGPTGVTQEWEYIKEATQKTITEIEVKETSKGRTFRYQSGTQILVSDMIFDTEADALVHSEKVAIEHNKDKFERAEGLKVHSYKSYSWHVGYHRREAKKDLKSAEYHERKAVACEERAKVTATK